MRRDLGLGAAAAALLATSVIAQAAEPWTALPPLPHARQAPAAAAGNDGRLYVLGGINAYTTSGAATTTALVDAYDPGTHVWAAATPLATPRASFAAVAGRDGRIDVFGGYTNGAARLSNADAYDAKAQAWQPLADMPTRRSGLAATVGTDGRVFVMGGCSFEFSDRCHVLATLEIYDPASNSWTSGSPMPTARASLAAATGGDGRIYAIGGEDESQRALNTVEVFDPAANAWTPSAPMPTARTLLASATGADGRVYAIGGNNSSVAGLVGALYGKIEVFDPRADSWSIGKPMPQASQGLAATLGPGGLIYVFGGANIFPIILDVAYAYAPTADQVAPAGPAPVCQFVLGFQTLHSLDPTDIGECVDNQLFAPNGDALQHTAKGLLAWRKADNWTAFTNGYQTWINGPKGLQTRLNIQRFPWEANPEGLPLAQ